MNITKYSNGSFSLEFEPTDRVKDVAAYSHMNAFELLAAIEDILKRHEKQVDDKGGELQ